MLTVERLRSLLDYDPETGEFSRNGSPSGKGYTQHRVDGKRYLSHRLAWFYVFGEWPRQQIDHINGIKTDNRIGNLRDVSQGVNQQNRRNVLKTNKTGFLGVSRTGSRFKSTIEVGNVSIHLGQYRTPEEAAFAYSAAKRLLHTAAR